ncbi:hypothetical protein CMK10_13710 [Candidatus Poribacteria bacterium]|jgi:hypothetical protein|nr:hypothetical protein [Candidatus Poribacteria bacterium]|tara:strand:- start:406 stop:615 length:210 start_codon:yes stop_codon:yes gene_type:complete
MAIVQVTDNLALVNGSFLLLLWIGKQLDLKDILDRVIIRKPKLVQQLGIQQVRHIVLKFKPQILEQGEI